MTVTTENAGEVARIIKQLQVPFDDTEVKWKPQAVKGDRALAICYVDARCVMDRLDEVVQTHNWQDSYTVLPEGSVMCQLSVRIGGEWITKVDVGSESEQPDQGDRMKAAFSDALKRAAVKFGIGRHLYSLPQQWVPYDPQKRKFLRDPRLPVQNDEGDKPSLQEMHLFDALLKKLDIKLDAALRRLNLKDIGDITGQQCREAIAAMQGKVKEMETKK